MEFSKIIEEVNKDKRLLPDLLKAPKGNNFRAVSESAILEVINPVLNKHGIFYTVEVLESHLDIKEAWGSKGRKLQFIATIKIRLHFKQFCDPEKQAYFTFVGTDAVGMGIDDNDKAMGKAYTYAVKYALLKLFRLQYGDDADAEASEPLYNEKPKENVTESKENAHKGAKNKNSSASKEQLMTENQRDYILGLMQQKGVDVSEVMGHFDGLDPTIDEHIPMRTARAMIKWLDEYDLPF